MAGITINLTIGDKGIITRAKEAAINYKDAERKEQEGLDNFDEEILKIQEEDLYANIDPGDNVARIKGELYPTLQEAINAVPETNVSTEVVLMKDISENVNISQSRNVVLNLNNKEIKNKSDEPIIDLSGKLELKNGNVIGTYTEQIPTIKVETSGDIEIANAKIDRSSEKENSYETVELHGKLTINSGKINSPNSNTICTYRGDNTIIKIGGKAEISSSASGNATVSNRGNITMEGGTIISTSNVALSNYGEARIIGGTITSENANAIENKAEGVIKIGGNAKIISDNDSYPTIYNTAGGNVNITGGSITSTSNIALNNYGEATITGGALTSEKGNTIYNQEAGVLKISENAEITSNAKPAVYNYAGGTTTIEGGSITSTSYIAVANFGNTTITGGTITSNSSNAVSNQKGILKIGGKAEISSNANDKSTIYVVGGTITVEGGSITSTSNIALSNYGEATITGGTITANSSNAISNQKGGVLKIGGKAEISSNSNNKSTIYVAGGTMTIEGGNITSTASSTVSNNGETTITGGTITSENSNVIINNQGGKLEVSGNAEISSDVNKPTVCNYGEATITGGNITSVSNAVANYSTGVLKIGENASITSSSDAPTVYNKTGGNTTITGGNITQNIEGKYAIYSETNGEISGSEKATVKGLIRT